jgi:neutral amino acid transport system permease protein
LYYLQLTVNGLSQGLVVGLAALGITLVFGIARFANASAGDGLTFGAYMTLIGQGVTGSLLLGAGFAIAMSIVAALLSYWLVFKQLAGRSTVALLVGSIGLAFLLRGALGTVFGHQQQVFAIELTAPYRIGELAISALDLQMAGVAALCLAAACVALYFTPVGRQMRGIKTVVSPEIGWEILLPAFAAAILGGIGSPVGAIVAGLLLGVVQEISTPFVGFSYKIALSFVVILFVLLVRPRGLFGRVEGVR